MPNSPAHIDPLLEYSMGRLQRADAIRLIGLRDHAELLVALGDAALPMPSPAPEEIESQAVAFENLWRQCEGGQEKEV